MVYLQSTGCYTRSIGNLVSLQPAVPLCVSVLRVTGSLSHTAAYKSADGKKIDGKRVVVDVERGRTVKSWRPRRLGGGLGGTRRGGPNENIKYSGRIDER